MDTVRLGLIGFGAWTRSAYVPSLEALDNVQVISVAAPSDSSRQAAIDLLGPGVELFTDYRDLLDRSPVDAVAIALPGPLHAQALAAALDACKHILYEPPIAVDEAEAMHALETAACHPKVVRADLELRCLPVLDFLMTRLLPNELGEPFLAKVSLWCDWGLGGGDWLDEAEPQGFFPWLGCWYVDVLDRVFAVAPERVFVTGGYAANRTLMDHGWASFSYPSGAVGQFEFNMVAAEGQRTELTVVGTRGEAIIDLWSGACRWKSGVNQWHEAQVPCAQPVAGFSGMRESIAAFIESVRAEVPDDEALRVAERVHKTVFACARSEAQRQAIRL